MNAPIETDYLIVGAGAAGMAFTDAILAHSNATVTIVDRRDAPGGHWLDAYPYVRLHQPSAFYGVDSVPLGGDAIDATGTNAGFYELAGADELRAYYPPRPSSLASSTRPSATRSSAEARLRSTRASGSCSGASRLPPFAG
jgi:cation diffusion facilitator CzcD-associated flavoprotein CzcO